MLPGGDTGRSVIGLTDIDGIGIAGLEMQFDSMLTGVSGERQREVAPGGRSIPGSEVVISAPVPGDDLILTIDRSIQHACESALTAQVNQIGAKAGQCIVMDTDTGDLLAMATVKREVESGEVRITSGNLAAVDSYEPGSVAKVITVAAGRIVRASSFGVGLDLGPDPGDVGGSVLGRGGGLSHGTRRYQPPLDRPASVESP